MRVATLSIYVVFGILSTSYSAAAQDTDRGQELFRQCLACHAVGIGAKHKIGPQLNNVVGRKAGRAKGFNYSRAMRRAGRKGLVWSTEKLDAYLEAPTEFLPKNKMAFAGIKNAKDRKAIIAYLKTLTE